MILSIEHRHGKSVRKLASLNTVRRLVSQHVLSDSTDSLHVELLRNVNNAGYMRGSGILELSFPPDYEVADIAVSYDDFNEMYDTAMRWRNLRHCPYYLWDRFPDGVKVIRAIGYIHGKEGDTRD